MSVTEQIMYKTSDGQLFDSMDVAVSYDENQKAIIALATFMDVHDIRDNFMSNEEIATIILAFYKLEKK